MSSAKVRVAVPAVWTDISGAAANVAGMSWYNDPRFSFGPVALAFQASSPVAGDPFVTLQRGDSWYDKAGSAKIWAMKLSDQPVLLTGMAD
ncbi:hypothetical protein ACQKO5_18985 [Novosphingobium subterraneum]|uniref:hypothetical protein n=1 Tax=Novosphingobium subterraneum TaxID=48936 RepID=UPI003D0430B3